MGGFVSKNENKNENDINSILSNVITKYISFENADNLQISDIDKIIDELLTTNISNLDMTTIGIKMDEYQLKLLILIKIFIELTLKKVGEKDRNKVDNIIIPLKNDFTKLFKKITNKDFINGIQPDTSLKSGGSRIRKKKTRKRIKNKLLNSSFTIR